MAWNKALAAGTAAGAAAIAALARRYAAGVARADRAWPARIEGGLRDLGEVDEVSILPLVERLTAEGSGLAGEPGVSYLIRAGATRVLFDSGLSGGRPDSALARNAATLGAGLGQLDVVVISHLHADHVGGLHVPVHAAGTPLMPQAVLGSPHPPWQPISERDAGHVLDEIEARGPQLVALSGHDSTPWTFDAFAGRYRRLRAGDELAISAAVAA